MPDQPRETPPSAGPVSPPIAGPGTPIGNMGETTPPNSLTPEEQMALFEQALKETDWGHQPC